MAARLAKLLFLALVAIALAVVAVMLAASAAAARTTRHPQEELIDAASGAAISPAATAWLIIGLVALTAFLAGVGTLALRRSR